MSRIDELVIQHSPHGVQFATVGDVTSKASNLKWAEASRGDYLYIDLSSVDRTTRRITETANITAANAPSRARQIVRAGDVIFATTRPAQMRLAVVPPEYDGQIASTGYCILRSDESRVLPSFLAHLLGTDNFRRYIEAHQIEGNYPSIPDNRVRAYRIPVPPLEAQREIVTVLDAFTDLEEKLEAELKAERETRKRQYAHYQESLLLRRGASWLTLGDIGRIAMCKRVFKHETSQEGDVPFFKIGTFGGNPDAFISRALYDDYRSRYSFPKPGEVLISAAGTIGRAIPYDGSPAYFQDSNIVWIENSERLVLNSFLKHWYSVVEWPVTDGGTIKRLYNDDIRRAKIAVPPLDEQRRIVAILDEFGPLVDDLSAGLDAEVEARRQQYAYYRDRLLSFKEATG